MHPDNQLRRRLLLTSVDQIQCINAFVIHTPGKYLTPQVKHMWKVLVKAVRGKFKTLKKKREKIDPMNCFPRMQIKLQ